MSSGGGGNGTTDTTVKPYKPAEGNLNQILSESGNLYNQGVAASGYVAPTTQTLQGLAAQENLGVASQQQLQDTLAGNYLNPFLQPLLQSSANDIATSINSEFSGAGRTPGSPINQQMIIGGIADAAMPLAFQQYNTERANQLNIAGNTPSLVQTGAQLEGLERQKNMAPFQSLQQYSSLVNPIASGLPITSTNNNSNPNRFTQAAGGALVGSQLGSMGGAAFGVQGAIAGALLGGLL
mgnify:FL=1